MARCAAWRALPRETQRRIVRSLARRFAAEPPSEFQPWGVVSVGCGWRIRQSQSRVARDSYVLSFNVGRKLSDSLLRRDARIPRFWPATTMIAGRRFKVRVPVDVCETLRRVRAHGGEPVPRLKVTSDGSQPSNGAACVLLRDSQNRPWILSCHHVLGDSNFDPDLEPNWAATIAALTPTSSSILAGDREFGSLLPGSYDCIDAAICRSSNESISSLDWTTYPGSTSTRGTFGSDVTGTPRLCTPRSKIIGLRFLKLDYDFQMNYRSGAAAFMREVALFEVIANGERPRAGDSGSPVIGRGGVWLGMHIGGGQLRMQDQGSRTYWDVSVVLPSYLMLDADTFGFKLRLGI